MLLDILTFLSITQLQQKYFHVNNQPPEVHTTFSSSNFLHLLEVIVQTHLCLCIRDSIQKLLVLGGIYV